MVRVPYNPCGAIVDFGRHRYATRCRFFKNSDREDLIVWYPALPGARVLPYESAISYTDWDRDGDIDPYRDGVGEVWDARHVTDDMRAPPGADGSHQCGTRGDFEEGAVWSDDLPAVPMRPDGLPQCCPGQPVAGVLLGGLSVQPRQPDGGVVQRGYTWPGWGTPYRLYANGTGPEDRVFNPTPWAGGEWSGAFGRLRLLSPTVTGVRDRWVLLANNYAPLGGFGEWVVDGWDGWVEATMNQVNGDPAILTVRIRRQPFRDGPPYPPSP